MYMDINQKLKDDVAGAAITSFCLGLLLIPSTLWSGFVMLKLYDWFILPIQGAPAITIGNMIGASLILNMFFVGVSKNEDKKFAEAESWDEIFMWSFKRIIFVPASFLFFGWIYHWFFM